MLNRILRVKDSGLTYEADPRHAELLARSLGLQQSRLVTTPGTKYEGQRHEAQEEHIGDDPRDLVNAVTSKDPRRIKTIKRKFIFHNIKQLVQFNDVVTTHAITPYAGRA